MLILFQLPCLCLKTVGEIEKSTSAGSDIFEREMLEKQWEAGLKICGGLEAEKDTMKLSGGSNPLQHPASASHAEAENLPPSPGKFPCSWGLWFISDKTQP